MTLRIIPFEEYHIELIRPNEFEKEVIEFLGIERHKNMAKLWAYNSKAFTAINDGEVICCGGVLKIWGQVGEVWVYCSEAMDENSFGMGREIIKCFRTQFEEFDRVQAAVKADFKKAVRLAEVVGLKQEGILRKFGPNGEDYIMFGRVK